MEKRKKDRKKTRKRKEGRTIERGNEINKIGQRESQNRDGRKKGRK